MHRICVFAGSSFGSGNLYVRAAQHLGQVIVGRGFEVVYGGGSPGLMGVLADSVLAAGGKIIGVIPQALANVGLTHPNLSETHVVATMHERKALMASLADAFVALPGGLGTLEEAFEVWTWGQLGLHDKPLGLLNPQGFYDPLIHFIDHAVTEQFVRSPHRDMVLIDDDPGRLLDRMASYVPPSVPKIAALDYAKRMGQA